LSAHRPEAVSIDGDFCAGSGETLADAPPSRDAPERPRGEDDRDHRSRYRIWQRRADAGLEHRPV
jgi:hypothetical protein